MYSNSIWFKVTAALMSAIVVYLHFKEFPEVPSGFYIDESSVAYNSFSILKTGADEYGKRYPLFFRSFDNFQDPVYVYSLVPLISVFGPEKWVARLPGVLYKLAAAAALFFLLKRITSMAWVSLIMSFIFSVLPWTFVLGRTGIGGYMPMLLGLILSTHFLIIVMERNSALYAIFAAIALSFTMYSHQIGRPMGALIFITFILAYYPLLLKRLKSMFVLLSSIFICMLPMILYVAGTPESMTKRFSTFSIWGDGVGFWVVVGRFFSRYAEYFSPSFLFLSGDLDLRHNTNASGALFLVMAPLVLFGIWRTLKSFRKKSLYRFLLLALAVYPVAASLTMDRMHSTRCLNGAPFFCLIGAIGLKSCIALARKKKIKFKWQIILFAIFAVELIFYMKNYFGDYAILSRTAFNAPLVETIELAFRKREPGETIYVSGSLFHHPVDEAFKPVWYSHFLFFGRIDPASYQRGGMPPEIVSHYNPDKMPESGLLLRMNSKIIFDKNYNAMVVFNDEPLPDHSQLISSIPLVAGSDRFFELYRF